MKRVGISGPGGDSEECHRLAHYARHVSGLHIKVWISVAMQADSDMRVSIASSVLTKLSTPPWIQEQTLARMMRNR